MTKHAILKSILATWVWAISPAWGQVTDPTVLVIDTANTVEYIDDLGDPAKYGLSSTVLTPASPGGFPYIAIVGDIVAVNNQPVKGTLVGSIMAFGASPTAAPGRAIADITRASLRNIVFEFLKTDGSQIGSITVVGFNGGTAPPGAPAIQNGGSYTIVGGSGAFLGARGAGGSGAAPNGARAARQTSMAEDTASRRANGGGNARFVLQLIASNRPKVIDTASGPAVTHSNDFTVVTEASPAAPGEALSLFVTGLGATRPSREAGLAFGTSPLSVVASPVEVTIGGKPCTVISAVGYPGATDGYQVNVRLPGDVPAGAHDLQISSAWVAGPAVKVSVK